MSFKLKTPSGDCSAIWKGHIEQLNVYKAFDMSNISTIPDNVIPFMPVHEARQMAELMDFLDDLEYQLCEFMETHPSSRSAESILIALSMDREKAIKYGI